MSFENENGRTSHSESYLSKVEMKDHNVMIDGNDLSNNFKTYENNIKIAAGQGYD